MIESVEVEDPLSSLFRGRRPPLHQDESVDSLVRRYLVLSLEECLSRHDTSTALFILSTLVREMRFLPRLIFQKASEVLSTLADAEEEQESKGRDSSDARLALFQLYRLAIASEAESSMGVSRSDQTVPSSSFKAVLQVIDPLEHYESQLFGSGVDLVNNVNKDKDEQNEEEAEAEGEEEEEEVDPHGRKKQRNNQEISKHSRSIQIDSEEGEIENDKDINEDNNDDDSIQRTSSIALLGKKSGGKNSKGVEGLKRKRKVSLMAPPSSLEDRIEAVSREQELRHDFIKALIVQNRGQPEHTIEALAVAQAALQGTERPRNKYDPILYGLAGLAAWNLYLSLQPKNVISKLEIPSLPRWILSNLQLQSNTSNPSSSGNDRTFHNEQQASQHLKIALKYLSRSHTLSCKRMKRATTLLKVATLHGDREAARVARLVLHSKDVGATDSTVLISLCFALRFGGSSIEAGDKIRDENNEEDGDNNESENENEESRRKKRKDLVNEHRGRMSTNQSNRLSEWKIEAGQVLRRFLAAFGIEDQVSSTAITLLQFAKKEGFLSFVLKKRR